MLKVFFRGYFQMRMATDPDPSDEPRGVSGYTFALPGEPDFDRILYLQPKEGYVVERPYGLLESGKPAPGPRVGVTVYKATLNNKPVPKYIGARIEFIGAELTERNGILIRNDLFAIDPLRVQLIKEGVNARVKDGILLDREDMLDPTNPNLVIMNARRKMLKRRQPTGFKSYSAEVAQATGLCDDPNPDVIEKACLHNRKKRKRRLEALLEKLKLKPNPDALQCAALESRIEELNRLRKWWDLTEGGTPVDRRAYTLALQAYGWNVDINGPIAANYIGADEEATWDISFWMGGWDGDALYAFIEGEWNIPLLS
jgi:hypothetical protein